MSNVFYSSSSSLCHHGIKGQRWGIRRYQNEDGTLTAAGRRRVKKAMKQHERVMQATSSKRKQKREYKKFKNMTLKMSESEVKELISKLNEDSAINSLTETRFDNIKSNDNGKLIENGMKYLETGVRIANSLSAAANAKALNKYSIASKAADIEKAKAMTRESIARAEEKEFSNYKARMEYLNEKEAKANAGYTKPKQTYIPVKAEVSKPNLLSSKMQYTPVKAEVSKPTLLPAQATTKPQSVWRGTYASSGINYMNTLKNQNTTASKLANKPLTALPAYSNVSKQSYTPVMMQVSQTALPATSSINTQLKKT